jgi:lysyl-tRNA synthetase class 2
VLKDRRAEEKGGLPAVNGDFLWRRAAMIQAIRRFFIMHGYLEVETPLLIPAPAPETHIDAISCGDWFLHTSPELCMKRLLAAGYPRLFQICRCFRSQERGMRHLPEFTLLEWYQVGSDYKKMMSECEAMLSSVFRELGCGATLCCQGRIVSLQPPWEMVTVADAFDRHAPLSLSEALRTDCFDEMMACHIEPELGLVKPTFLYDYPLHPGCLAKAKKDAPTLSERFELYIGGLELANAFSELTDAEEQRRRFEAAERERLARGKPVYPVAERFLTALSSLPEAAGIALGIDRLAMILTDRPTIDDVVAFVPEDL